MHDSRGGTSPSSALTPADQATILIAAVSRYSHRDDRLIEIRSRMEAGGMRSEYYPAAKVSEAVAYALDVGQKTDTFVGMGLRNRRAGSRDAVEEVQNLWVDCDSDEALDALRGFSPEPSFVVRSGGLTETGRSKLHAYWALKVPLPVERVKPTLQRLARALAADPACAEAARVMRVPGTLNFKSDPPAPVVLEIRS